MSPPCMPHSPGLLIGCLMWLDSAWCGALGDIMPSSHRQPMSVGLVIACRPSCLPLHLHNEALMDGEHVISSCCSVISSSLHHGTAGERTLWWNPSTNCTQRRERLEGGWGSVLLRSFFLIFFFLHRIIKTWTKKKINLYDINTSKTVLHYIF